MTLFAVGEAATLPAITQLVQVHVPADPGVAAEPLEHSELSRWLQRAEGKPELPIRWASTKAISKRLRSHGLLDTGTGYAHFPGDDCIWMRSEDRPRWHTSLQLLAQLHHLGNRLLTAIAIGNGIPLDALEELNDLIQTHVTLAIGARRPEFSGVMVPLAWVQDLDPIPQEHLVLAEVSSGDLPFVISQVLMELRRAVVTPGSAALCTECHNPFLVTRPGQRFCSHRHANREGERRRRAQRRPRVALT